METNLMSQPSLNNVLNMDYKTSSNFIGGDWATCQPLFQSYYHYWPSHYYYEPNKFEQAFKILRKLIDKDMVKIETVKQFIETVADIQSVL